MFRILLTFSSAFADPSYTITLFAENANRIALRNNLSTNDIGKLLIVAREFYNFTPNRIID